MPEAPIGGPDTGPPNFRPESLETLLGGVLPQAYSVARRLTRNVADAEDLIQEAAIRACRYFDRFRPGTNFRAWFLKILTNCFYGRLREDRRRGEQVSLDDAPPLYLYTRTAEAGLHEGDANPAATLLARLDREQIERAIDGLPEPFRAVATLFFVDDLDYEEIGDVLSIPAGTVRSRLHRGRRLLQKTLWDLALEHGIVQVGS